MLAEAGFERRWSLDVVKTLVKNIIAISLTLLIFVVGLALCGRPQPEHTSQWCHCCHFFS